MSISSRLDKVSVVSAPGGILGSKEEGHTTGTRNSEAKPGGTNLWC